MTSYKRFMKKVKKVRFDEDYVCLPYGYAGVSLESRDVFATPCGLLLVACYNVGVARDFYLPNGDAIIVYEDGDDIPECETHNIGSIRIYNDFPHYHFIFDDNDKLIAVRYCRNVIE